MRKFLQPWLLLSLQAMTKGEQSKAHTDLQHAVNRHIRSIDYPEGSGMGLFFAIAIPLDIPDKSISLSWYFEANYGLPTYNSSYVLYDDSHTNLVRRSIDRRLLYDVIQTKLERHGYPGKACLLRTICESAKFPFEQSGLVGDIIRIILRPSSSIKEESLQPEIEEAEFASDCSTYQTECPLSFLDLISYSYQ